MDPVLYKLNDKKANGILSAAEELISENGFASFSFSALAKKISISRGIIYYYFKNEQNIVAKLISDKMIILIERLESIPRNTSGLGQLKHILDCFQEFLKEEHNYLNLISYFTTFKLKKINKSKIPFYSDYEKRRDILFNICLEAIIAGIADGSIDADIDPPIATYAIWAGVGSFWEVMLKDNVLRPVKQPNPYSVDNFLNAYFKMILKALRCC